VGHKRKKIQWYRTEYSHERASRSKATSGERGIKSWFQDRKTFGQKRKETLQEKKAKKTGKKGNRGGKTFRGERLKKRGSNGTVPGEASNIMKSKKKVTGNKERNSRFKSKFKAQRNGGETIKTAEPEQNIANAGKGRKKKGRDQKSGNQRWQSR